MLERGGEREIVEKARKRTKTEKRWQGTLLTDNASACGL